MAELAWELAPRSIALPLFLPATLPCRACAAYVRCVRRASYAHALPKPHCPLTHPCSDVLAFSLRLAPSLSSAALSFARSRRHGRRASFHDRH